MRVAWLSISDRVEDIEDRGCPPAQAQVPGKYGRKYSVSGLVRWTRLGSARGGENTVDSEETLLYY